MRDSLVLLINQQLLSCYETLAFFRGKSSSELNLIFIYFPSKCSGLLSLQLCKQLLIDLIRSLIWFHSSS